MLGTLGTAHRVAKAAALLAEGTFTVHGFEEASAGAGFTIGAGAVEVHFQQR